KERLTTLQILGMPNVDSQVPVDTIVGSEHTVFFREYDSLLIWHDCRPQDMVVLWWKTAFARH
ncbi:MAG: hypothetical protein ABSE73_20380, partial [Planctomycetota bacterium]